MRKRTQNWTFSKFDSCCWASWKISEISKCDAMEMRNSLVYNILAELCHLLWIAFRAVHVIEVNWVVNNNHIELLRWWRRNRKGEKSLLSTVGTGLGCLNISADGWDRLCCRVCSQQVSRCPFLLFILFLELPWSMFYRVPKHSSSLHVGWGMARKTQAFD